MDLSQTFAETVKRRRGSKKKRDHKTKHTLENKRNHGNNSAGNDGMTYHHDGCLIQKRIDDADCTDERQHDPELVEKSPVRYPAHLKQNNRIKYHGYQPAELIFAERNGYEYIYNCCEKFGDRMDRMDGRSLNGKLIHFFEFYDRMIYTFHKKSLTGYLRQNFKK